MALIYATENTGRNRYTACFGQYTPWGVGCDMKKLDRLILKVAALRQARIRTKTDGIGIVIYDKDSDKWHSPTTGREYNSLKIALAACKRFFDMVGYEGDTTMIINDADYIGDGGGENDNAAL